MMSKCKDCKWWDDLSPKEKRLKWKAGQCHRNAPPIQLISGSTHDEVDEETSNTIHWPFTEYDDWCGEFQPK